MRKKSNVHICDFICHLKEIPTNNDIFVSRKEQNLSKRLIKFNVTNHFLLFVLFSNFSIDLKNW